MTVVVQEDNSQDVRFYAINVNNINAGARQRILESYLSHLRQPWSLSWHPSVPVMRCVADINERHYFLLNDATHNEAEVRYVFGNSIVEMLCRHFFFKLTLEQTEKVDDSSLNTSQRSRYDYVIWRLLHIGTTRSDAEGIIHNHQQCVCVCMCGCACVCMCVCVCVCVCACTLVLGGTKKMKKKHHLP